MAIRRMGLFLLVCSLFVASAQPAPGSSGRWSPAKWKKSLSKPIYNDIVNSTHYITATDGSQLSLTLHLPAGLKEGTHLPTLLQLTPYQPLNLGAADPSSDWAFFVLRGAAYVEADARGTNGSEGCLDFGGSLDRSDARVFAKWIRKQPWSNGVIVTDGVSHPGMGSVVAHAAIPGLAGALAHAPVVSYYQDEWLQGAKFEDQFNGPLYQAIELAPSFDRSIEALKAQAASCTGRTTLDFSDPRGPFIDLWADRDLSRHVPKQRAPILLTHGFVDQNVHPDHSQLYWDALPDDYPKYAIFGWWYHGWPDMRGHPFAAAGNRTFTDFRHRWLDTLLFRRDNGLWQEPRVLVEDSQGTWHEGHDWPLEPSRKVVLYPTTGGGLAVSAGKAGEVSYDDPVRTQRGFWTNASAVFRTQRFGADQLINGAPKVHLKAKSSVDSTKWVAYLIDEAPDGTWQRVTHGYADSHSWGPEDEWRALAPGKAYRWTVKLMPTAVVVGKGHRLLLLVTSQDSRNELIGEQTRCFSDYRGGCYGPSGILPAETAGRATNSVIVGPEGTRVELFWVDPDATAKPPWKAIF